MTIQFERRTDRPDAAGRCTIYLRAYFDGQRPRFATREKCLTSEWTADKGQFRRSFAGYQEANEYLASLAERIQTQYRQLRTEGVTVTPALLKAALQQSAEQTTKTLVNKLIIPARRVPELFAEYRAALEARGNREQSLKSVTTTLGYLTAFGQLVRGEFTQHAYDMVMHDKFLSYLRTKRKLAQNSIWKVVKHIKAFLRYVRDDRKLPISVEIRALRAAWAQVEKIYLTDQELVSLERALLPSGLVATRDAFLFCCYTGLRYSDLRELTEANVQQWQGGRVLRLTQSKTRTGVSIYLTTPAAALLDKYAGTRAHLLPAMANQVMNRNLKRIAHLAGLTDLVEVVTVDQGRVVKSQQPKYELVTMHTARHTFATQSLLRGMPVEVLQKVLGHSRIQTTMVYAKVVEDFQHQTMRRIWEGEPADEGGATAAVCAVEPAA